MTAPEARPRRGYQEEEPGRGDERGRTGGSWAADQGSERNRGESWRDDERQFERDSQRWGEQSARPHRRMNNDDDRRGLESREQGRQRGHPYDDDDRVRGEYGEREPSERWREREPFEGDNRRRYRADEDGRPGDSERNPGEGGSRYRDDERELRYQNESDWRSDEQRFRGEDRLRERDRGDEYDRWRDEGQRLTSGQRGGDGGQSHSGRRYPGRGWRELDDQQLNDLEVAPGLNGTGNGTGQYIDRDRDWRRE